MKKRNPVSNIMSSEVVSVNKTQSLTEVSELLEEHNIRHIPVVSGEAVIGMISKTDLQKISFVSSINEEEVGTSMYNMLSIEQVMSKTLETVDPKTTIYEVAQLLAEHEFHALPVVENNKLVGMVTTTDLINYLIDQF
ncbi:MAG: CBS domain-containing protein [Vicingaceae bacterium]